MDDWLTSQLRQLGNTNQPCVFNPNLDVAVTESCYEMNMEETVTVIALPHSMEFKEICTVWGELCADTALCDTSMHCKRQSDNC